MEFYKRFNQSLSRSQDAIEIRFALHKKNEPNVRYFFMERPGGIEPLSQPWQGRILTIKPWSHHQLEGPNGFEPMIRVLQTHALPLGYIALKDSLKMLSHFKGLCQAIKFTIYWWFLNQASA